MKAQIGVHNAWTLIVQTVVDHAQLSPVLVTPIIFHSRQGHRRPANPVELSADAREAIMRRRQGVEPNPKLGGCSRDDGHEADNNRIPRQGLNLAAANFDALASHAIQLTLPVVSFSLEEILETDSNGSTVVWMNSSDSHQAIRNVVRRLNHWYYSGLVFSDSIYMEPADLLMELAQLTNIRHWQSLVEHIARIWYNTAMSCRAALSQVGQWKWSVNKMLAVWRSPIRSIQCATLNPTVAPWMERIEHLRAATYKNVFIKRISRIYIQLQLAISLHHV